MESGRKSGTDLLALLETQQRYNNLKQIAKSKWMDSQNSPVILQKFLHLRINESLSADIAAKKNHTEKQIAQGLKAIEADLDTLSYNRLLRRVDKIKHKTALLDHDTQQPFLQHISVIYSQLQSRKQAHLAAVEPKMEALCLEVENWCQQNNDQQSSDQQQANTDNTAESAEQTATQQPAHQQSAQHTMQQLKEWQSKWQLLSKDLDNNPFWSRFRQATKTIYDQYLVVEEQEKLHKSTNDKKRKSIVQQLQAFATSENMAKQDNKSLLKFKQHIHADWKAARPHNKASMALNEMFHQIMNQINEALYAQVSDCIEKKQALIDNAKALAENDQISMHDTNNRNRLLMLQWKTISHCGKKEQALWQDFSAARDVLRKKIKDKQKTQKNLEQQDVLSAKLLYKQLVNLEATATTADPKLAIDTARTEFDRIAWQNPVNRKYWQRKFDQQLENLQKAQSKKHQAANAQNKVLLLELIDALAAHNSEFLLRAISALPESMTAKCTAVHNQENPQQAIELACIQLEIALSLDTPSDYQKQRNLYQLQALQQKFNNNQQPQPDNIALSLLQRLIAVVQNSTEHSATTTEDAVANNLVNRGAYLLKQAVSQQVLYLH